MGRILYLHIGMPEERDWNGNKEMSAIAKKAVPESLLTTEAFDGDGVAATEFHGGPDRAVCIYPIEHYEQWSKEFGRDIYAPTFGENISAAGMKESEVYIGDIYRLGNATVQISQGRIPCSKISKNNEISTLLKRVVQTGYTGYFFRVLEEGTVQEDAEITLLERKQDSLTILEANQIFFHRKKDYQAIRKLLEIPELAEDWKQNLLPLLKNK